MITDSPHMLDLFTNFPTRRAVHCLCASGCVRVVSEMVQRHMVKPSEGMLRASALSGCFELVQFLVTSAHVPVEPWALHVVVQSRSMALLRYFVEEHRLPVEVSHFQQALQNLKSEETALAHSLEAKLTRESFLQLPSMPIVLYIVKHCRLEQLPRIASIARRIPLLMCDLCAYIECKAHADYFLSRSLWECIFCPR